MYEIETAQRIVPWGRSRETGTGDEENCPIAVENDQAGAVMLDAKVL